MSQLTLNYKLATQAKNAGILKAITNADAACPGWSEKAYDKLKEFLTIHTEPFQAEEVRSFAAIDDDFPLPPHARAWGGVIAKAAHERLIRKTGVKQVKNVKAHCANAAVWIKV